MVGADTDQQLAWEQGQKPRAAAAAAIGAVASLAADILSRAALSGAPTSGISQALQRAAQPGPVDAQPSVRTAFFQFYSDHQSALIAGAALRAIGFLGIAWALTFLASAVRARRPQFPKPALYVGLVGAVLQAISVVLGTAGSAAAVSTFLSGPRTVAAATDVTGGTALMMSGFLGLAGSLALALGFVLVALHAMRTGLLTRFMGGLGIICGILVIIPIGPLAIVQAFWLVALALLFLGRVPRGVPPAWVTGEAEPWPSSQPDAGADSAAPSAPVPASGPDASPGARRKRKRRA